MAKITLKGDAKITARTPADEAKAVLGKKLIHVCHYNQLDKAKALIAAGADPNYRNIWGESPIYAAAGSGGLDVLEYLASLPNIAFDMKTSGNQTLLHNAVASGHVQVPTPRLASKLVIVSIYSPSGDHLGRQQVLSVERPGVRRLHGADGGGPQWPLPHGEVPRRPQRQGPDGKD